MSRLIQDLRLAVRQLAKRPLHSGIAAVSVAVGMGISLAVFSAANAFFGPRGVIHDEGSLLVTDSRTRFDDYLSVREKTSPLLDLVATRATFRALDSEELGSVPMRTETVSGNYFSALGLAPVAGRLLSARDDFSAGLGAPAVISHRCWQERFGSDPAVLGRTLWFGTVQLSVVGVAPPGFGGMRLHFGDTELWEPLGADALGEVRAGADWRLLGRVRGDVPVEQAQAALRTAIEAVGTLGQYGGNPPRAEVHRESENTTRRLTLVSILTGLSGLALLVACVNVAGLLAARFEERRSESAVRLALGAGRWRIVRQLLTESFVLTLAGAGLGILAAHWTLSVLRAMLLPAMDILQITPKLRLDGRTLFVTLGAIALATIAAGLMPALGASRTDLAPILQRRTVTIGRGRRRLTLRDALVVLQLALAFGFLSAAAVFVLGARGVAVADRDLVDDGPLTVMIAARTESEDYEANHALLRTAAEQVRSAPGVIGAALESVAPAPVSAYVSGPASGSSGVPIGRSAVQSDYFRIKGLSLLRGRLLTAADEGHGARVVVVSKSAASRLWPDAESLGQFIRIGGATEPAREVVGVVDDAMVAASPSDPRPHRETDPFLYMPYGPEAAQEGGQKTLLVRGSGDTASLATAARTALRSGGLGVVVLFIKTQREIERFSRFPLEVSQTFVRGIGLLAIVLALVGLQGIIAHSVERRRAEIGARMSLGATPNSIVRLILRTALRLSMLATVLGLAMASAVVGIVRNVFPGLPPLSLAVLGTVGVTLAAATLVASYLPARRAARIDPMVALRCE